MRAHFCGVMCAKAGAKSGLSTPPFPRTRELLVCRLRSCSVGREKAALMNVCYFPSIWRFLLSFYCSIVLLFLCSIGGARASLSQTSGWYHGRRRVSASFCSSGISAFSLMKLCIVGCLFLFLLSYVHLLLLTFLWHFCLQATHAVHEISAFLQQASKRSLLQVQRKSNLDNAAFCRNLKCNGTSRFQLLISVW